MIVVACGRRSEWSETCSDFSVWAGKLFGPSFRCACEMSLLKPCDLFSFRGKRSVSGRSGSEGWSVPAWVRARGSGRAAPTAQLPSRPPRVCPQSRALSALPCLSWRLLLLRCVWGLWSSAFFLCRGALGLFGSRRTCQS